MKDRENSKLFELLMKTKLVCFDFDGVFTDNYVYVMQDGTELVRCSRADGLGLERIRSVGVIPIIVSTEKNPVVLARAKKLKLRCINGVEDKGKIVVDIMNEYGVEPINVMFVGNDINDIPAFERVGLPVAVADAFSEVLPYVIYRTTKKGGHGAVREICDLIYETKKRTERL